MIDSKGRTYIKIYCCGDCVQYNWRMHRCKLGAHVDGTAGDCFYLDCPYLKEEKEPTWIPVSEMLPEENGVYLVYAPDYRGGSSRGKEWHDGIMFASFKNGKWSIEHGYYSRPNCVIAWMPLPKPYPYEGDKE